MKNLLLNIKDTTIVSLRLCLDANHAIEKILWFLLGILGNFNQFNQLLNN